jgi:hypothetical protein
LIELIDLLCLYNVQAFIYINFVYFQNKNALLKCACFGYSSPTGEYHILKSHKLKVCRLIGKVDESVKVKKLGVMYEVGNRMLILCERVQERVHNVSEVVAHNGSESIGIVPEGSLMCKMEKVKKVVCIN